MYLCANTIKSESMKKTILLGISVFIAGIGVSQQQIGNSGFENWENVTGGSEPVNWNSFLTCTGSQSSAASAVQLAAVNDARPGSTGTTCARIWTRLVFGFIKANGNVTLGRINAGSVSAGDANNNYNFSSIGDPTFSEAFTSAPDSIVFWIKYNAASGSSTARMKATLHDDYAYHDPEGTGGSANHIVASAVLNFSPSATWVRKSVAFDYSIATSPDALPSYILVTFASNSTPGGGDGNDEVFIDDVELIYNAVANQQMTANDDVFTGNQDSDIICDILANDTDPENMINPTSVVIFTSPTNGTVDVDGATGVVTYTPATGFSGTDMFTYQVCDSGSPQTCDQATVNINVNFLGLNENSMSKLQVKSFNNNLLFSSSEKLDGTYTVYNLTGELVQKGKLATQIPFNVKSGVYLVSVVTLNGSITKRIYKN